MEIFVRLPAELKSLIYNEFLRGGKRVGNKWVFPLDKERIERFQELYNKKKRIIVASLWNNGYFYYGYIILYVSNSKYYHIQYNYSSLGFINL
jgi:hypothetical protein